MLSKVRERLSQCKLELSKTKIVYCKDNRRNDKERNVKFDFLGFSFQPRTTKSSTTGKLFLGFNCGISKKSRNKILEEIRQEKVLKNTTVEIQDIANRLNPKFIGWVNYYGKFRGSELHKLFQVITGLIIKWIQRKF